MVSKCLTKKERAQRHTSAPFEVHSFFGPGWGVNDKETAPTALAASEVATADRGGSGGCTLFGRGRGVDGGCTLFGRGRGVGDGCAFFRRDGEI